MAWTDTLNRYGLAGNPPPAQLTPLTINSNYAQGSIGAGYINGEVTGSLKVGTADNDDIAVYINSSGIFAGNAIFSQAPFSVDMNGNLVATSATITGTISGSVVIGSTIETASSGQRVVITPTTIGGFPGNSIVFYDSGGIPVSSLFVNSAVFNIRDNNGNGMGIDLLGGGINLNASGYIALAIDGGSFPAIQLNQTGIGFFAASPVAQPIVTGSKGGNAALSSLMSSLSSLGLVFDATT